MRAQAHTKANHQPYSAPGHSRVVQRKCDCGGDNLAEDKERSAPIQRLSAGSGESSAARRFGHDFGEVRVHHPGPQTVQRSSPEPARAKTEAAYFDDEPEDERAKVERSAVPDARPVGSGRALPEPVRATMETAFEADFSEVRIHEGPEAGSIGAVAYTRGTDIHFAPGRYDLSSRPGQQLLGHELTHVVQQRAGRVPTPQAKGGAIVQDSGLEAEADMLGAKAARGEPVRVQGSTSGLRGGATPGVLRPVQCASIAWDAADYSADATAASSTTVEKPFNITYKASQDKAKTAWNLEVASISGGAEIKVHTGGSRDPVATPPTTEAEAKDAVTVMKGYYDRGSRGTWHTEAASKDHEMHHYKEWKCSADHYWPPTETALKKLSVPTAGAATEADAITALRAGAGGADAKMTAFRDKAHAYWFTLADNAKSRPYAAGQLALNSAIIGVQALATTNKWTVPKGTNSPSAATPCYQGWLKYSP
jgi:hypothetical protein